MNSTLVIMVGLPGSGKSTLARRWVGADVIRRLAADAEWP